ncbi:MAG: L,D-transpeptidase [Anaerolineae bacterium]|nr:L,D-transpeptidase [Anaerolineae bacterium]
MADLTRREFLQVSGIAFSAGTLLPWGLAQPKPPTNVAVGRTLRPTNVYSTPGGTITQTLLPDSVLKIKSWDRAWYASEHGFVARRDVQPMYITGNAQPLSFPDLIEVSAPAAPIHVYADAASAVITRIGHGGVLYALDALPDTRGQIGWYQVANADREPIGWTQATRWCAANMHESAGIIDRITVEPGQHLLTAFAGEDALATLVVSGGTDTSSGIYVISGRQPAVHCSDAAKSIYGAPWCLMVSNDLPIVGAYWHNDFETRRQSPTQIELTPQAARWLYAHVADRAIVEIV